MTAPEFVFPDPGVPTIPIERVDLDSEQAARYVEQSRPFVSRVDWPALEWSPEYLRRKIGHGQVKAFKRDGTPTTLSVNQYIDLVDGQRSGTGDYVIPNFPLIAIRDPDLNPDFACLEADLRLPSYVTRRPMRGMYVWLRNTGCYDNKSHVEPNAAANFNLQIRGKKHVWLFPPEDAPYLGVASPREEMMGPPYFSAAQTVYGVSAEHPEFANVHCYETVLEPGDLLHIPTFWFHWFVHHDSYLMNFNCWSYTEQIPISPVASEWAYMKALILSLGGFEVAAERFAALPMDTQELLTAIARTLVTEPRCTNAVTTAELMRKAKGIVPNAKLFTK